MYIRSLKNKKKIINFYVKQTFTDTITKEIKPDIKNRVFDIDAKFIAFLTDINDTIGDYALNIYVLLKKYMSINNNLTEYQISDINKITEIDPVLGKLTHCTYENIQHFKSIEQKKYIYQEILTTRANFHHYVKYNCSIDFIQEYITEIKAIDDIIIYYLSTGKSIIEIDNDNTTLQDYTLIKTSALKSNRD